MERDNSMNLSRSGSLRSSSRTTLIRRNQSMSAKQIRFYRNGDRFFNGLKLAVSPERYKELDALLAELSTKLDLSSGAVRFIFNGEDGSMITDISQLHYGVPYVCSSTNTFKQLEVGYGKTSPQWALAQRNSRSTHTLTGLENILTPNKEVSSMGSRDFIKPKLVTVIRNGKPPQKKVTMLLNNKTAISLDQVLDHLSAKGSLGKVDKLYSVDRKLVKDLRDLFDDDTVFIAFASTEKFPEEGVELDPNSSRQWQSTAVIRHDYMANMRPDLVEPTPSEGGEAGKENRPASARSVSRAISFKSNVISDAEVKEKTRKWSSKESTSSKEEVPSIIANTQGRGQTGGAEGLARTNNKGPSVTNHERPRSANRMNGGSSNSKTLSFFSKNKRPSSTPPGGAPGKNSKQKEAGKGGTGGKSTGLARSPIKAAKQAFQSFTGQDKGKATKQARKTGRSGRSVVSKKKNSFDRGNANERNSTLHGYFVYVHEESQNGSRARPTALVKPSIPSKEHRIVESDREQRKKISGGGGRSKASKGPEAASRQKAYAVVNETVQSKAELAKGSHKAVSNSEEGPTSVQERPNRLSLQSRMEIQLSPPSQSKESKTPSPTYSPPKEGGQSVVSTPTSSTGSSPAAYLELGNDSGVGLHEFESEGKSIAMEFTNAGESLVTTPYRGGASTDEDEGYPNMEDKKPSRLTVAESLNTDGDSAVQKPTVVRSDSIGKSFVVVSVEPSPTAPEATEQVFRYSRATKGDFQDSIVVTLSDGSTKVTRSDRNDVKIAID